jgi:hypothetical protein
MLGGRPVRPAHTHAAHACAPRCRVVVSNCAALYRGCMGDSRAGELFQEALVSRVLGAFELNCLGITVESPLEDLQEEVKVARRRASSSADATQAAILEVRTLCAHTRCPCATLACMHACLALIGGPAAWNRACAAACTAASRFSAPPAGPLCQPHSADLRLCAGHESAAFNTWQHGCALRRAPSTVPPQHPAAHLWPPCLRAHELRALCGSVKLRSSVWAGCSSSVGLQRVAVSHLCSASAASPL